MSLLRVVQPGLLSLLQDGGRFGRARLGLTTGGPMDPLAYRLCNRLLQNPVGSTVVEVSFGGIELEASADTQIAVTGADLAITIDGRDRPAWQVIDLREGQQLRLAYSEMGCRSYIGVRGGFAVAPSFGSTATVVREHIGGLRGVALQAGDELPVNAVDPAEHRRVAPAHRPQYGHRATVRVIPGYQQQHFPRLEQRRFFGSEYAVSQRCDRMGYRLEGPQIGCDIDGILSEGISMGAIQVPADGQPIVLLNDRQTIGGYPKIGNALSLDCAALAQLRPGDVVNFAPISEHAAHNALHLHHVYEQTLRMEAVRP